MRSRTILIAGALVALAAPQAAAAFETGPAESLIHWTGPDGTVFQARVAFDDLDLRSPIGVRELKERVHRAADQVCGAIYRNERGMLAQRSACWWKSVQAADPEIAGAVARAGALARK
jgi:UrcA family protein